MDTICQGIGFITESFCKRANINIMSPVEDMGTLPSIQTGHGNPKQVKGYATVQMAIECHVSTVTLFVFGNFVFFDALLGQSWPIQHDVV
jgi:hypothetical protein